MFQKIVVDGTPKYPPLEKPFTGGYYATHATLMLLDVAGSTFRLALVGTNPFSRIGIIHFNQNHSQTATSPFILPQFPS